MTLCMYKRWTIKTSPCTATFNDLLCLVYDFTIYTMRATCPFGEEFLVLRAIITKSSETAVWSAESQPTFRWYISPLVFRPDESVRQETSDAFCLLHACLVKSLLFNPEHGSEMFLSNIG
jgi:hypothetical protein